MPVSSSSVAGRISVKPGAFRLHGALAVDGVAGDVEHAAKGLLTHGHGDGAAGVKGLHAPGDAVGGGQGDAPDVSPADLLHHLQGHLPSRQAHLDGVIQLRQISVGEMHVHHRADHSFYDRIFHSSSL